MYRLHCSLETSPPLSISSGLGPSPSGAASLILLTGAYRVRTGANSAGYNTRVDADLRGCIDNRLEKLFDTCHARQPCRSIVGWTRLSGGCTTTGSTRTSCEERCSFRETRTINSFTLTRFDSAILSSPDPGGSL